MVDGESVVVTHLTETIRKHAAQLLTRQDVRQLLDQLKEINEAVRYRGCARRPLARRDSACVLQAPPHRGCVSIRDLGAIVEAVGDKVFGSLATPVCSPNTRARRWDARSPRHTWTRLTRCASSRSIRRSSRSSQLRSPRRAMASTWQWSRRGHRLCSVPCAASLSTPLAAAALGPCCSARPESAGTCGDWSRRLYRTCPFVLTTKLPPASA